ncbi:MAG: hypothetical protein K8J08_14130, partial [Thermoanaerobaculia bacterium]|nr:hypothetical protein [Thermoanaerobaculia bacterium]
GGVYVQDSTCIDLVGQTLVYLNTATSQGGGVAANSGAVVALTGGVSVQINTAELGGGVYLGSTAHMGGAGVPPVHMSILSNSATYGGGIYLTGAGTSANLNNYIIEGNSALTAGGGVAVRFGASFELDRSNDLPCQDPPRCATLRANVLRSGNLGSALFVDSGAEAELYQVVVEFNNHSNDAAASRIFAADGTDTRLHLEGVQLWENRGAYLISATNSATVTAGFLSAAQNYWPIDPNDPLDVFGATASSGGTVSLNSSILVDTRGYGGAVTDDCLLVDDETGLGVSSTRMVGADPMFVDVGSGNLHLRAGSPAVDYCDTFVFQPVDLLDIDLDARGLDLPSTPNILGSYDLGIDESLLDTGLFADGFESGDTSAW